MDTDHLAPIPWGQLKACKIVKEQYPYIQTYDITLFNSFALTGKGHLTEEAIKDTLSPAMVTFSSSIDLKKHPNTMFIKGIF